MRTVILADGVDAGQRLEVCDHLLGLPAQGPVVDHAAAALQKQHLIEGLRQKERGGQSQRLAPRE